MKLVVPSARHLPSYRAALSQGWSPTTTDPQAGWAELASMDADPAAFVAAQDDRDATGPPITLPDGTQVARLPGYRRWMWDGQFAGVISLRWQPGTSQLPEYVLGHVGYGVVPWARRRGYATAALRALLTDLPPVGLSYLELTTEEDNVASQRVIAANGGLLVERFAKPAAYGPRGAALRWRIPLPG